MKSFAQYQLSVYQDHKVTAPGERRKILISEMVKLELGKIDCFNCTGTCCTYNANSMQITPIEALDILTSLEPTTENAEELKTILKKNIQDYRLDHEIFVGKKNKLLRKTYTCPFFVPGPKGCTIKKELKPYGCLGFNPRIAGDNGSLCLSDIEKLEAREAEQIAGEDQINLWLKKDLNLDWDKLEIPKATLKLLEIFFPK